MQIPIISGIVTKGTDFRTAYPLNLIPVPKVQGISEGYLRPAEGVIKAGEGPGNDRGGVRWRDRLYRVFGTSLCFVPEAGAPEVIGTIPGLGWCAFDNSFQYLAINNGAATWLYNGDTLQQITDSDFGASIDILWVDGYFMSTDGEFLVVTDLGNPFNVNPLKYGSSELNPDAVVGLQKLRNEVYAINRYTIEVFTNTAGALFPFSRVDGAQVEKGAVQSRAVCEFGGGIAFLGGGFNEANAVWVGASAQTQKLSTREIDDVLREYTEDDLSRVVLESRSDRGHEFLYVHMPDKTLVYDGASSAASQQPVWHVLQSGVTEPGAYRARGMVWCYNRWNVADPNGLEYGYLTNETGGHYGADCLWEFSTPIVYNASRGGIMHELELVSLSGNVALNAEVRIGTQYSLDGETWSQNKTIPAGRIGQRNKRLVWYQQGNFRNWRVQRFTGDSRAHLAFVRLEAQMEPLTA